MGLTGSVGNVVTIENFFSTPMNIASYFVAMKCCGFNQYFMIKPRLTHVFFHDELSHRRATNITVAYEHDSAHPWISFQISGFPQVINAVRMSSPSRGIPNRFVYERIFSAAKVVNSVVNLADLQLRTL